MAVADLPWRRPAITPESHRATSFEIFFDLVFVFAITRVVSFMAHSPSVLSLARGLILFLLLWWSWAAYAWLGNRVRADRGVVRTGMLVVMAALFVAALVMPDAFGRHAGTVDAPLVLAVAFCVVRAVYFGLYLSSVAGDRRLRDQLLLDAIPQTISLIALLAGAVLGGTWQTVLWAAAFAVDFGGGRIASGLGGWSVRSAGHFAERHRMVLIIALGESLISAGAGAGDSVADAMVLLAALVGFAAVVCLWLLYFRGLADAAEDALERASGLRRAQIARDAYTMVHFPLIAGALYIALGAHEVLAELSGDTAGHGRPLEWPVLTALYAGAAVFLLGRAAFARLTVRAVPGVPLVVAVAFFPLIPVARLLPAIAALGLVSALLLALVAFEWRTSARYGGAEPG
ncbi:low temperature requirement protein A [Actinomadura citrea]|nr:low temperature requirement protein A [Actinomadura citrea]